MLAPQSTDRILPQLRMEMSPMALGSMGTDRGMRSQSEAQAVQAGTQAGAVLAPHPVALLRPHRNSC